MNLEEMRKRINEIVAKLSEFDSLASFTEEDTKVINGLNDEFTALRTNIETKETLDAMKASAATGNRQVAPAKIVPAGQITVSSKTDNTMGFENLGEFAKAVSNKSRGMKVDRRFENEAAYEKFSEDGGVLIPTDFMTDIQTKAEGDASLLARSSNFKVNGNHLSLPVDEQEPWNGGIKAYWVGEGEPHTESKGALKSANWRLHKLGALVKATDELLDDAAALESYIKAKAPQAITAKLNDAILNGDGVAKPQGLLNSGFKIAASKEVGQAADTIVYENIVSMEARHIMSPNSIWIANPMIKEQLRKLKDENGNHVYMNGAGFPNLAAAGYETLMGKPIVYMMGGARELGTEGDLILADLSYYYSIVKTQGIQQSMSTHLLFDRDQTAFKFITRVDGSCPFSSPVKTQYGDYEMSGFVTLEDR